MRTSADTHLVNGDGKTASYRDTETVGATWR
jgi:hypothetical protein